MEGKIVQLLQKYIDRSISAKEVKEIRDFMQISDHNRELVIAFIRLHKVEMQADFLATIDKTEGWRQVRERMAERRRRRIFKWATTAAAVLVIVLSATLIYTHNLYRKETALTAMMQMKAQNRAVVTLAGDGGIEVDGRQPSQLKDENGHLVCENKNGKIVYYKLAERPMYNKVSVMEGSTYQITLSDGTNITLSSGSEIVYPIGGDKRNVMLKGEALFDVKHDEHSPFVVSTENGTRVTVLGTVFNVQARHGQPVTVTVESGRVGVDCSGATTYLSRNEQASFGKGEQTTVNQVDAQLYTSWASGVYEFNDVPMTVIARQLSLWYGVDFVFASPKVKERKFTGALLRNENLGYTLSLLNEVSNLKFSVSDDKIVIE